MTLKTSHSIDQHADQQPHDRLDRGRMAPRGVKLCPYNGIRSKRKFFARRACEINSRT
jgi:hypothetical protein